ncbi:hypothetical protein PHLGIDRAFT_124981 [Phlebiopsis gigantea 11061_1 CR5-6]|uniref:Protein-S-isoprenylcysteine O-methyltransferase n=1 Tax=Phlebiopsis gigantea (strain 11061_1 CR5-6) TaxID=745531 RepID=A0A0C3P0R9_PHLG1|nr:hypothetical protein PHLGIDRAFT_124981 [Phlebiopsis gigantea 11061_1 CR5-6]
MSSLLCLRLLFIPVQAVCVQYTFTPPTKAPPPGEQDKYETIKRFQFGESGFNIIQATAVVKYMTWAVNIWEFVTILTHLFPTTVYRLPHFKTALELDVDFASSVAGALLLVSAAILRVSAYRHLGRFFTYQLSIRNGHKLVKDGPYSIMRHPSYTALVAFFVGNAWYQLGPGSIWMRRGLWSSSLLMSFSVVHVCLAAYVSFVVTVLRVPKEDRMLKKQFREEWEAWSKKTPYRLLPLVY